MNKSAFPYNHLDLDSETNKRYEKFDEGMNLRDYFAAKIMQGLMLDQDTWFDTWEQLCESAYCRADDMMEARKK